MYTGIRDFLSIEKSAALIQHRTPRLTLVTTWLQNQDDIREYGDKGVKMPFNVNNIDASVGEFILNDNI